MSDRGDSLARRGTDAVEALLRKAAPRPAPPGDVEQDIRAAVQSEWTATCRRRNRRRLATGFALAATVTLALAISLAGLFGTGVAPVGVASIDRSMGTLYVQSGSSGTLQPVDTTALMTGQILTTGHDSAAGLRWLQGGSLRVDADTQVEFVAPDRVFLHSGRLYFDSFGAVAGSGFSIESTHGVVSHVGTQFMTESSAASLAVSVREGEVTIDGSYHDRTVHEGYRVEMTGSALPSVTNTSAAGDEWRWVESVAPGISVDGMSVFDFLHWVGRETGHTVQFESESAEALARSERFDGAVDQDPRSALRMRMMTIDLDARFDTGGQAIIVTD